jgi:hypothetical protein
MQAILYGPEKNSRPTETQSYDATPSQRAGGRQPATLWCVDRVFWVWQDRREEWDMEMEPVLTGLTEQQAKAEADRLNQELMKLRMEELP